MDSGAIGRAPSAAQDDIPVWWPKQLQTDWRRLPPCAVEWLVVWNVNLGGGQEAFSVRNGYWGNHDFLPNEVPRERAYVWHAQGVPAPTPRGQLQGFGGIPSRIGLTVRGVPSSSGIVLVPPVDGDVALRDLVEIVDEEIRVGGGAWCPALIGTADGVTPAVSIQRSVDPTPARLAAERAHVDDIVVVDPFGDRGYRTGTDPCFLVRGRFDGTGRRVRPGHDGLADVPVRWGSR